MNEMTEGHTHKRYDGELSHLHQLVLEIARLGREQLASAVQTLEDEDVEEARRVIERDNQINELDVKADEELVRIIAKRQPMARDLREILTVGKIVSDLERVGDEARKIARLTIHFYDNDGSPPPASILRDVRVLAAMVNEMQAKAVKAFDRLDLQLAVEVIHEEVDLVEEFKASLRRLSTFLLEDARSVGHFTEIVLGLRALERIGGHAKNIGGYVVFLVKGRDVRHEPVEVVEDEIRR